MRKTADTAAPFLLIGALILLVILGAGAFKKPGYQGADAPAGQAQAPVATAHQETRQPVKAKPTPTARPKATATPAVHRDKKHVKPHHHKQTTVSHPVQTPAPTTVAAQPTAVATARPVVTQTYRPSPTTAPTEAPVQPVHTSAPPAKTPAKTPGGTGFSNSG